MKIAKLTVMGRTDATRKRVIVRCSACGHLSILASATVGSAQCVACACPC
jgi:hypothetical protein